MRKHTIHSEIYKELLESYTNWLDVLGYAPTTVYNLPNHLREFFHFLEQSGHTNLHRITTPLIQEYYKQLSERGNERRGGGLSKAFLNKHQQALKKFLEYLKEHNANVKFGVHLKGEKINYYQNKDILTQVEIKQLFEACDYSHINTHFRKRDRAILVLLYSCGLRRNEAVQMNTEDILFEKGRIYVRKGKNYKERFVPINTYNLNILEDYLYEARLDFLKGFQTDALLLSQKGQRINDMSMAIRVKTIIEASGNEELQDKHITLHTLRHSIATHLMQQGVAIQSISQFLGHASLESTQLYTHLVEQINDDSKTITAQTV